MGKAINLSIFLIGALLLPSVYPKILPSTPTAERKITPELQKEIDDVMNNIFLPTGGYNGLGLAIVRDDGELLYTTGYGVSNIEKGIPSSNKTQYGMGSLTKGFTAIMVVRVLHEHFPELGEAALDMPINKLIPGANLTMIDRLRSEHTTFRDLLAHRTCVQESSIAAEPFSSREEMIYRTRYNPATISEPRSALCYSNVMYGLAGEYASMIGGKSYEDLMQDLFDDLGMVDTTFIKRSDNITEMPNRAVPYYIKDNQSHLYSPEILKRIIFLNAAGGMVSTPDDMVRYLRFHVNGGSIDGKEIIPEEVVRWLKVNSNGLADVVFKDSENEVVSYLNYGYGLGFQLAAYNGWESIEHVGNLPPYSGQLAVFPGKKLGIYSATHEFPGGLPLMLLSLIMFEMLSGNPNSKENVRRLVEKAKADHGAEIKMAEEDWHKLYEGLVSQSRLAQRNDPISIKVGKYGSGPGGDLELSERFNSETNQTQYFIEYGKWYHGWLAPVPNEPSVFEINWVTDAVYDDYMVGLGNSNVAIIPGDDTITIINILGIVGVFKLGESLDTLPVIPWDPNSC